jgi:hypothetical protein
MMVLSPFPGEFCAQDARARTLAVRASGAIHDLGSTDHARRAILYKRYESTRRPQACAVARRAARGGRLQSLLGEALVAMRIARQAANPGNLCETE